MSVPPDNPNLLKQFVGIDNLNPITNLKPGHVRDMVNLDATRDGTLPARRRGHAEFYAGTRVHSVWGDGDFPFALFHDNGTLYGLSAIDAPPLPLVSGLTRSLPISYARMNDAVLWSNGVASGTVLPDGDVMPWACEAALHQPTLAPHATVGGLNAGRYQVAITYRDAIGREGGTPDAAVVDVPQGGGITLSAIPQPLAAVTIRIYVSKAGGTRLHHAIDVAAGTTSLIVGAGTRRKQLSTQFHTPLPAGHLVAFGHGRVWTFDDNVLRSGEAMWGAQGIASENYITFPQRGALLAPVGDGDAGAGVFVAAGKRTIWLGGADPAKFTRRIVDFSGAVEGTLAWASGSIWGFETTRPVPSWLAGDGQFCVGLPGGELRKFNIDTVATDTGERGASLVRERAGQRHHLTVLRGPATSGLQIRDRATATVRRNGVVIPP